MRDEMDFEIWAQEYEADAEKINAYIEKLSRKANCGTKSQQVDVQTRILNLKQSYRDLCAVAKHLRDMGKQQCNSGNRKG